MTTNFHDNKLWQGSYVALMDLHAVFDDVGEVSETDEEVTERVIDAGGEVAAKIADGLSRMDKRYCKELIYDTIGMVAVVRTQLAIAWGRGLLDDNTFKKLDDQYAKLSVDLQNYR